MSDATLPTGQSGLRLPRPSILLLAALAAIALAYVAPSVLLAQIGIATGCACGVLAVLSLKALARDQEIPTADEAAVAALIGNDPSACFVTDVVGEIAFRNTAAQERYGAEEGTLAAALSSVLTNPSALVARLTLAAEKRGSAREDVVTRKGHMRINSHLLPSGGALWRVESLPQNADASSAKAASEKRPLVVIGRNETVLFMNEAARDFFGERARSLGEIVASLPIKHGEIQSVITSDGPRDCVVTEVEDSAGRRELAFSPVRARQVELPANTRFFEELPVPLIKLSPEGTVIDSNKMARELLGRNSIDGETLGALLEGLGRSIKDWLQDTLLGRVSRQSEFLKVRRDDAETFVQVTLKPAMDGGDQVLVGVLSDATELKTLEAQFVQSQKMQAIGQLAGGVAHDFNNLLTAITGHCDLLMLRHSEADADFADLEQINQNANRAAALVSQLLAFSRKQTLRPEVIEVQDTLSDLTHLLGRLVGEAVHLEFEHAAEQVMIRADKRQIEQVVMNLVVNARDAMPRGGTIKIRTEVLELEKPLKRDRAEVPVGRFVQVKVVDEGKGIPPDKLQKIFEPFFTTKRTGEGTGLGLSTAYGIVKQTGGFIFADSTVGEGSAFTLIFPAFGASDLPESAETAPAQELPAAPASATVLLVEDEAPVRAFASRALALKGFTVLEAASGEEALEIANDVGTVIDLFVTDVMMPGLNGPEWVSQARNQRPDVRTVFMSGYAEDAFSDEASDIGNTVFLQKPFSLVELTDVVQRAVQDSEAGESAAL